MANSDRTEAFGTLFVGPIKFRCGAVVHDRPPRLEMCSLAS